MHQHQQHQQHDSGAEQLTTMKTCVDDAAATSNGNACQSTAAGLSTCIVLLSAAQLVDWSVWPTLYLHTYAPLTFDLHRVYAIVNTSSQLQTYIDGQIVESDAVPSPSVSAQCSSVNGAGPPPSRRRRRTFHYMKINLSAHCEHMERRFTI